MRKALVIVAAVCAALGPVCGDAANARANRASEQIVAAIAAPHRHAALPAPVPLADTVRVAMVTDVGEIDIDIDGRHAPATAANFLRYVDLHRLDGASFYRAMRLPWGTPPNGLIEGGLSGDPHKVLPPVKHEPTNVTGILNKAGAISMARFAPGTATADFSILVSDQPGLDADPTAADPERQAGFAAFGHVVSGMDVVRRIYDAPLSPTAGSGVLKGQMLEHPVHIVTVRRVVLPSPPPG
ncbi:MAG: peptidylprolyl isomerase [Pseudomonadota bacterium]|nr:peptidylprolyl isomerase [Pseudomonadota bacterium]